MHAASCCAHRRPALRAPAATGQLLRYSHARCQAVHGQPGSAPKATGVRICVLADVEHVLAVNKPAGIPFHGTADGQPGLVQLVRQAQAEGSIPYPGRLWPVHRLDAVTSGICLFGKSPAAAAALIKAFREHKVVKYYVALSGKRPARKQGSVVGDMARSRRSTWKLLRTSQNPAVTRMWSTGVPDVRPGVRLWLVKPETGRTHQIRVALKSNSSPILGDMTYAAKDEARLEARTYLHAAALRICIPGTSVPLQIICPPWSQTSQVASQPSSANAAPLLPGMPETVSTQATGRAGAGSTATAEQQLVGSTDDSACSSTRTPQALTSLFDEPAFHAAFLKVLPLELQGEIGAWLPSLPLMSSALPPCVPLLGGVGLERDGGLGADMDGLGEEGEDAEEEALLL